MNREIKFRGKIPNSGKWINGYLFVYNGIAHILSDYHHSPDCSNEVILETVGQFTGLHDKNGVEIYDGDKIICEHIKDENYYLIYTVIWDNGSFRLASISVCGKNISIDYDICEFNDYTVIGNIHDNPELLKIEKS